MSATLALATAAALAAFVMAQGYEIGLLRFVTPLHHDDFSALANGPAFHFWIPRPVSTNFIYMLGSYGGPFYFIIHAVLNALALALTVYFAHRTYSVPVSPLFLAATTAVVTLAWLCMRPSVYSFQYLGLGTNLLSYLFAVLAVSILQPAVMSHLRLLLFFFLCVLTAFAKEDMVLFVLLSVLIKAVEGVSLGVSVRGVLRANTAYLGIVVATYALSVFHSKIVGSAFTSGAGAYNVSNPAANLVHNGVAFWTTSAAMQFVLSAAAILVIVSAIKYVIVRSTASLRDLLISLLPFAAALPYLLLPRFVDYYAVSFVPMMIAFIAPGFLNVAAVRNAFATAMIVLFLPASATYLFHHVDQQSMQWGMGWYLDKRQRSAREVGVITDSYNSELRRCNTIAVLGINEPLGPFANSGSAYANRALGAVKSWRISASPDTSLAQFAGTLPPIDKRWVYVASDAEALSGSDCALIFDEAGNGDFQK